MKEIEMSLLPHPAKPTPKACHQEEHVEVGAFIKSFIYGGLDGTINILTLILSASAINLPNNILVAVSLAATFGDAIGMGLGDYVSYQSEQEYILAERHREEYELQHMREEEIAEMEKSLMEMSFSGEESKRLTKLYLSNEKIFVDLMMLTELGLVVNHIVAWQIGLVNFCSFMAAGIIPLIPYMLALHAKQGMLFWSGLLGVMQLFALGYVKGMIIRGDSEVRRKSGLEVLILGVLVTTIGSFLGSFFGQ